MIAVADKCLDFYKFILFHKKNILLICRKLVLYSLFNFSIFLSHILL